MRGRRPIPTSLKLINGNPGGRPLNHQEPQPVGNLVDPPDWLSESQKEGWRDAIADAPHGLLRRLDSGLLVTYVVAQDLHRKACQEVEKYGMIVKAPHTGVPMQSPFLAVVNRQAQIMVKCVAEMGFSPSSRSRVKVESHNSQNRFGNLQEIPG